MNDELQKRIISCGARFDLETRCSRTKVSINGQETPSFSVSAQFPLVAHLQERDDSLSSPESAACLVSFRRLYDFFSNSYASCVQGPAGDAQVSFYRKKDGVRIDYKF